MTRAGFSITRREALAGALGLALAGRVRAATPASEILAGSGLGAMTGFALAEAGPEPALDLDLLRRYLRAFRAAGAIPDPVSEEQRP